MVVDCLDCIQALVEVERNLSVALERAAPLMKQRLEESAPSVQSLSMCRTMKEVEQVLALARTLASRTSAPSGWNPTLPVVTFATPNPLPHQLRGGALGAMQLNMAKLERKRKKDELEKALAEKEKKEMKDEDAKKKNKIAGDETNLGPEDKAKLQMQQMDKEQRMKKMALEEAKRKKARQAEEAKEVANMNLSDSSSSEEEDDDDDDDDDGEEEEDDDEE